MLAPLKAQSIKHLTKLILYMNTTSLRILIVDDEPNIRFLLQKMLEKEGHKALLAENGLEALKLLETNTIDLILSDIKMPQMDGLEFLSRVHVIKPQVPVIIMTADPNMPKVKAALKQGALDFLEKPFDLSHIFDTITRYATKRLTGRVVSMKDRYMLFVVRGEKRQPQLLRALLTTQGKVHQVSNEQEALELAATTPFELVVYAIGEESPDIKFFERINSLCPNVKTVCVCEQYDEAQLTQLVATTNVDSIVFKNKDFSESEFIVEIRKLFSQDIFGIEKYLAWGFEPIQHIAQHTDDRFHFIEEMSNYLKKLNISPRFISWMENIADEFLSNALYNAPVDRNGKPLYRQTDRKEGRPCQDREKCILTYAYDGNHFCISIEDHFGSINKTDIFEGIKRCILEKGQPLQQSGGAGLGLYLSFQTLNKFIINIHEGKRTEMIGLCNISSTMKKFDMMDKSLCIFTRS